MPRKEIGGQRSGTSHLLVAAGRRSLTAFLPISVRPLGQGWGTGRRRANESRERSGCGGDQDLQRGRNSNSFERSVAGTWRRSKYVTAQNFVIEIAKQTLHQSLKPKFTGE